MPGSIIRSIRERLRQDIAFAARQLRRSPSFALTAAVTLTIGIGATAAMSSVIEAVLLRPLPFTQPDRVVNIHLTRNGSPVPIASNLEFAQWRALAGTRGAFTAIAASVPQTSFTLTRGQSPELVRGGRVSADYLRVLGVHPASGRGFNANEDQPGAPHVVLLSHRLWVRDYASSGAIVGQTIRMDGDAYTVIGVMPAVFDVVSGGDELWAPLTLSPTQLQDFKARYLQVVGRLAPDVTLSQATSAVDRVERRLSSENASWGKGYAGLTTLYSEDLIGGARARLYLLFGAVAFVLLIACVNVANLLLARGSARAREMAVRAALGASRSRLIEQLLTEAAVLSAGAGALGIVLAVVLVRAVIALSPAGLPRIEQTTIDGAVVAVVLVIAVACSLMVGLLPALRITGSASQTVLREGGRGGSPSRSRTRTQNLLVVSEVALAVALLSGAGLLIRSAWALAHIDPGFDSRNVFTAQVVLPVARYPGVRDATQAYRAIHDQVAAIPGVRAVAFTSSLPLTPSVRSGLGAEGQPMTDGERLIADIRLVSPGYFGAMGIAVQAGRDFAAMDDGAAPLVAIINEALAKKLWPGQRAVGKRIEGMDPSHQHFMTVVGVIHDQRDVSLNQPPLPEFYIPYGQAPAALWSSLQGSLIVVAKTQKSSAANVPRLDRAIAEVDPTLPITNVTTMDQVRQSSLATSHFNTLLISLLGGIALVLAVVGVYGLIAFSVSQRTWEIGVRTALGATPAMIAGSIIARGLAPVGVGVAVGVLLALTTTRLLRDQLFGVAPGDPITIAAIVGAMLVVAVLASVAPIRRALRISPVEALAG
ncbi:MAG TPA: ABC transporter permease [Gemmatimonadaceae bacterium]|jgi:predicted permease